MKKGAWKSKGSAFERESCRALSKAITGGRNLEALWRSAMSGGRATVQRKKKLGRGVDTRMAHVAGDICAVHADGEAFVQKWFAECKHYRDLKLVSFLFRSAGTLHKFWAKAKTDARRCGKRPMLIFKQNGMETCVLLRAEDLSAAGLAPEAAVFYRVTDGTYVVDFATLCQLGTLA